MVVARGGVVCIDCVDDGVEQWGLTDGRDVMDLCRVGVLSGAMVASTAGRLCGSLP